jgi:neutral trehalase
LQRLLLATLHHFLPQPRTPEQRLSGSTWDESKTYINSGWDNKQISFRAKENIAKIEIIKVVYKCNKPINQAIRLVAAEANSWDRGSAQA